MRTRCPARQSRQRGAILIAVLVAIVVAVVLLGGIASLVSAHFSRAVTDASYAAALDMAEAGVNYEFYRLTQDPTTADQYPGRKYNFAGGSFTVYCMNRDGTTPWVSTGQYLTVVSTGTVAGVSRTLKVQAKGYNPTARYAIYTLNGISIWSGSSAIISGDVGTNGQFQFSATPTINGWVQFNGASAGWSGGDPGVYQETWSPKPILWPTVDSIANQMFPLGGLTWLKDHSDNAKAVPPIVNNSCSVSTTLVAGNYYLEYLNLAGSSVISFDNRLGPVNLWIGPSGGTGTCKFRGGTAYVPIATDPTKANHVYVATQSGIDLGGNSQMDALIYAYNTDASGAPYGYATNSGNPVINGQIIANHYDLNGNIRVNYIVDLIQPITWGYYGYDNSWVEVNPR